MKGGVLYEDPLVNLSQLNSKLIITKELKGELFDKWENNGAIFRVAKNQVDLEVKGKPISILAIVAADTSFHRDFISDFEHTLWYFILFATILTIYISWFAVKRGLKPIGKVSRHISCITAQELNTRLDKNNVPVELSGFVESFNYMITRIEDSFDRLSHFSADIAHELRTPITNLSTQTQVATSKIRTGEEYREILYSNLEEFERLSNMVGEMLMLAKADNGLIKPQYSEVSLVSEFNKIFEYYSLVAEEKDIRLALTGENANVYADKDLLRQVFCNLVSNAIRYSQPSNEVKVHISSDKNGPKIDIENTGNTIPENQIDKIFDRFYQVDPSRHHNGEGTGLGLAIVKSIVDIHCGKIKVFSENCVTRFSILLPD